MSTPSWTAENVAYVLRWFDAGVLPAQILIEMRAHGYPTLHLETIEQCLRVNGRAVDGLDPSIRTPLISNTFNARGYQGQPTNYFGDSMVGNMAPPKAPHVSPSDFRPQSSSKGKQWDAAAASYALNAHRDGRTVMQIWGDLNNDGYVSNAAEVAASLNAQGVDSVRVVDYLKR